jgi:hypothetical protein
MNTLNIIYGVLIFGFGVALYSQMVYNFYEWLEKFGEEDE